MQLITKKNCTKKNPLCATTRSLSQLDEKMNHMKISKFKHFEIKGCKGNSSFYTTFGKFKFINFKKITIGASHTWKKIIM
jgi:hypothetical protein